MMRLTNFMLFVICYLTVTLSCSKNSSSADDMPSEDLEEGVQSLGQFSGDSIVSVRYAAFTGVNVITMEGEGVILENQTVLVEDGVVTKISAASETIPDRFLVEDATGKYMMPGLADMHTHVGQAKDMSLYPLNGVTKVRHMWGDDRIIDLRNAIEQGDVLGPKMYVASVGFEEPPSNWPGTEVLNSIAEVDGKVKLRKDAGFDFIKIYENLSPEMYDAVLAAADKYDIRVVGHISPQVGIEHALESSQASIAHIAGYLEYAAANGANANDPVNYAFDEQKLQEIIERTIEDGVWNCPTMTITTRNLSQKNELEANPELKYVSPTLRSWFTAGGSGLFSWPSEAYMVHKNALIKAMNEAGANLMLGVDTGLRFLLPGFTVHEELENFVSAGLTPYEALETATINPARFLGTDEFGTISVGKKADFIILDENPLADIRNTWKISGVMMGTTWMSIRAIGVRLEQIAESYN